MCSLCDIENHPPMETEAEALEMVRAGVRRLVSTRRKNKLKKRGEFVWWCNVLHSWYWEPRWMAPNPNTESGLPWLSHKDYRAALEPK
jgi:hypothetical protein